MSTKSSSKFWKKLGLGKKSSSTQVNRPPSVQSHGTNITTTLANNDDDQSIKSKRFSGVLPHRKQSTNSMKRLHQMTAVHADTPALPSATHPEIESKQTPEATTTFLTPTTPLPSPQPNNTTTLGHHVEQTHQVNHVNSSTPPLNPDLGKLQDDTMNQTLKRDEPATSDQPSFTALESNMKSCNTDNSIITHSTTDPPTRLTKRKSSTSLKKTPKSLSSSTSTTVQSTSQTTTKSRLRQPTRTNSSISTNGSIYSITPSTSSSLSSLKKDNTTSRQNATILPPPPPLPTTTTHIDLLAAVDGSSTSSDQKDQLIQQLQEALQTEQSINQVLQGQKEAITRDLDYFSLTVDELMEEKESLVQKYEEEKLKAQSKEEDLNVLLDKLKASTNNARERSMEVDQWKTEIENLKEELSTERNELKSVLKQKDQFISKLKNELAGTKEEIKVLSSRLDQFSQEMTLQEPVATRTHPLPSINTIETPGASPRLDAQKYSDNDDTPKHHNSRSLSISTTPSNLLDNELMALTKEKEKLQSDYSKIPISGGGPTSRRRKEQLEEMLDEVDSQLSKVKQKIRQS